VLDIIIFFNAIWDTLRILRRSFTPALTQPLLTAAVLTALYGGYNCVHESSIAQGLWVAFFESNAARATRLREREDAVLQAELRDLAQSNKVIDQLLGSLIEQTPNVARVRLDVIHNGVTGVTGLGLLRYDTTNSVAGAGHDRGPLVQNRPLTEWGDFLPDMLGGRCRVYNADDLRSDAIRSRMETLNVGTILGCPVADVQGRLLGAVFMLWDAGMRIPDGVDLTALKTRGREIGSQVGAVLDLRAAHTPRDGL
jgi:hypothetical protein